MFPKRLASGGVQNLLKLKDKDFAEGVFRGESKTFYTHWVNNRSSICPRKDCPLCAEGERPSFRFRVNFITKENGALVSKVFEQGARVYDMLASLATDYDMQKTFFKITRNGLDKNTNYMIMPMSKRFTEVDEKLVSAVPLTLLDESDETVGEDVP